MSDQSNAFNVPLIEPVASNTKSIKVNTSGRTMILGTKVSSGAWSLSVDLTDEEQYVLAVALHQFAEVTNQAGDTDFTATARTMLAKLESISQPVDPADPPLQPSSIAAEFRRSKTEHPPKESAAVFAETAPVEPGEGYRSGALDDAVAEQVNQAVEQVIADHPETAEHEMGLRNADEAVEELDFFEAEGNAFDIEDASDA